MKKVMRSVLYALLLLLVTMCVVACGEDTHTHTFGEEKAEEKYLATAATRSVMPAAIRRHSR